MSPMQASEQWQQGTATGLGYVITGLGRSGTTFLAHIFKQAGYDMGDAKTEEIGVNAPIGGGMEHREFARVNILLQEQISSLWDSQNPDEARMPEIEDILDIARPLFKRPWPFILKDPRFCDTAPIWFAAGYRPKHVFLCMRSPIERNASITQMMTGVAPEELRYIKNVQRTYHQYFSIYALQVLCLEHDIPLTMIHYPRIGRDEQYANRMLAPFINDLWTVVRNVWNASLYHQKEEPKERKTTRPQ